MDYARLRFAAAAIALSIAGIQFTPVARAQAPGKAQWQAFEYLPGRYRVSFPARPVMQQGKLRTEIGVVVSVRHTSDGADATYDVTYNDYPKEGVARLSAARLLDTVRDGLVYQSKGTLTSEEPFTMGKLAGREFGIDGEGGVRFRIRLLLVDDRLYQLTAMAQAPARADHRKFFDSFRLVGKSP